MPSLREKTPELHFNPADKPKGIARVVAAFKNSLKTLTWLSKNEAAFRQELGLLFVAIIVLSIWHISLIEKAILLSSVLFIFFAEIINTAIEATIDRVGKELHPLSGLAKDLGSAGVLLSMVIACLLWLAVLVSAL